MIAAYSATATLSVPFGTLAGGPMITSFGAQPTILGCAGLTLALGLVAAAVAIGRARRRSDGQAVAEPRPSTEPAAKGPKRCSSSSGLVDLIAFRASCRLPLFSVRWLVSPDG